ncbi:hypothetical protein U9M48_006664 [Paspalum notatum var. saurae]|uniref:Uncharacterized protein n=1 Tax=Paspalum notatum var. saurae TaxID=547442 RepID=A0AAQ3PPK3_PASNO
MDPTFVLFTAIVTERSHCSHRIAQTRIHDHYWWPGQKVTRYCAPAPQVKVLAAGQAALNSLEYLVGPQVAGPPCAPVQQYSGVPNASHALRHATVASASAAGAPSPPPPAALAADICSSGGHSAFTSPTHPAYPHVARFTLAPVTATPMPTLYPSTRLTSVNSASVTGGAPPREQLAAPLQSPVAHDSWPGPAWEEDEGGDATHPVRAHRRPDQPGGAGNETVALGDSSKPPPPTAAALFPDNVAGQIVWVQLLRSVNTVVPPAASAPNSARNHANPVNAEHQHERYGISKLIRVWI